MYKIRKNKVFVTNRLIYFYLNLMQIKARMSMDIVSGLSVFFDFDGIGEISRHSHGRGNLESPYWGRKEDL